MMGNLLLQMPFIQAHCNTKGRQENYLLFQNTTHLSKVTKDNPRQLLNTDAVNMRFKIGLFKI